MKFKNIGSDIDTAFIYTNPISANIRHSIHICIDIFMKSGIYLLGFEITEFH